MRRSYTVAGTTDAPLLQRLLNTVFSRIQADFRYVPKVQRVTAYSAAAGGDPVTVAHNLGVKPTAVYGLPWADMRVWATEGDRALWDERKIVVRGSAASTKMDLLITVDDD